MNNNFIAVAKGSINTLDDLLYLTDSKMVAIVVQEVN